MVENLEERAAQYVADNLKDILSEAFAKVYADGYRDGYYDCKDQEPQAIAPEGNNYVDLDLPSGTLWSDDYMIENDKIVQLSYDDAAKFNIPTEEQFDELRKYCKFCSKSDINNVITYSFIGRNGNQIQFRSLGYITDKPIQYNVWACSWLKSDEKDGENNAIFLDPTYAKFNPLFKGYKTPIRLVKLK